MVGEVVARTGPKTVHVHFTPLPEANGDQKRQHDATIGNEKLKANA
jgi:hypothetical protein